MKVEIKVKAVLDVDSREDLNGLKDSGPQAILAVLQANPEGVEVQVHEKKKLP